MPDSLRGPVNVPWRALAICGSYKFCVLENLRGVRASLNLASASKGEVDLFYLVLSPASEACGVDLSLACELKLE